VDTTHQATTLTVQVGVNFLLEGGLIEISGSNTNTEGNCLLFCLSSNILVNSDGGVDTAALTEKSSDGTSGSLWCNEDNVNIRWDIDLCLVLEDWGETVGEVEGL
jgi:hypothetical protein